MNKEHTERVVADIMIGERFYATFRATLQQRPVMGPHGECQWGLSVQDVNDAILTRYPSLKNKEYQVYNCLY